MQRGGKYLASGKYGCAFNPHLKCIDVSNKKHTIGKVFSDTEEHDVELQVMNQIKKDIDPNDKFTVPFHGSCSVHYYRKTDGASTCTHLDQSNPRQHKQLLYGYGGQPLSLKLKKPGSITTFLNILPKFIPLFEGLVKFNQYKIVHLDLKMDNLLLMKSKLYLIDFGLMQSEKDVFVSSNARVLLHDCLWYPPEFKSFLFKKGNGFEKLFKRVTDNFHGSNQDVAKGLSTVLKMNVKDDLEAFFNDDLPKKQYKNLASKVDVYSLGMLLFKFYLWSGFHKKTYKRSTVKIIIREKFIDLIKGMVHFDPRKRFTPKVAQDNFLEICLLIIQS